ncbi:MAG: hypothetical protein CMC53_00575 [Flavobacteriaceae bacterium]|nr:hypothetical protein [Flavobacteriaceae bacterium]
MINDVFAFCGLNDFEFWIVVRLYFAASIPFFLLLRHIFLKKNTSHVSKVLIWSFVIAAVGWEIWLTYGLGGGLEVDERRSIALSCAVPQNVNWLINSLADVFIVWIGILLVDTLFKKRESVFLKWEWKATVVFFLWFVAQNIYVESFFYHLQLGSNGDLSWAPLQPLGSWYNPTLFKINGNPITFQSQSSWVLMTPVVQLLAIYFKNKQEKSII